MNRETFIDAYIAAFMGSLKAGQYAECCAMGQYDRLDNHGEIEDAIFLAEKAWEKKQELMGRMTR
jgi:hypothetical protein